MRKDFLKIFLAIIISFFLTRIVASLFYPPTFPHIFLFRLKSYFYHLSKMLSQKKPLPSPSPTPSPFPSPSPSPFFIPPSPSPSPTKIVLPSFRPSPQPTSRPSPTRPPPPSPIPTPKKNPSGLSRSKLGVFIIGGISPATQAILSACPRIIKMIDPQGNPVLIQAVKEYKQNCGGGIAVLRFYNGTPGIKYSLSNHPEEAAEDFFQRVITPNLSQLGNDKIFFDYLQTPNEFETTPEWWGKEKTQWNGRFWLRLTALNLNAGMKTCIGSIPVGNTSGDDLQYIVEELRQMKNMGAAFCYHGYTFSYSKDPGVEINLSLRYRQYYSFFAQRAPDLLSLPLILSEGGVAENGDPHGGYLRNNHIEEYKSWLMWFDQELRKDSYVVGVTLFQIGNSSDWAAFNLEPIGNWLADYLINTH